MTTQQHGTEHVPSSLRASRVGSHEADAFDRSKAGPRARRVGSHQAGSFDRSQTKNAVQHHQGSPDERERTFLAEGFGAQVRSLRLAAGLTQAQLAAAVKCTRETVSMLENGRRRPEGRLVTRLVRVLVPASERRQEARSLRRLTDTSWRQWRRKNGLPYLEAQTRAEVLAEVERLRARIVRSTS